jgi:hypothetical protein
MLRIRLTWVAIVTETEAEMGRCHCNPEERAVRVKAVICTCIAKVPNGISLDHERLLTN